MSIAGRSVHRSRIVGGVAWNYVAQVSVALLQLGYAAISSRLLSPYTFGVYAVALIVVGLFSLIANGGLSQTISRIADLDSQVVGALTTYAVILGMGCGLLVAATADVWGQVWGRADAVDAIRVTSFLAACAPIYGLATGLMRRQGRFRSAALITIVGSVAAMLIGGISVYYLRSAVSLLLFPILSIWISSAFAICANPRFFRPRSMRGIAHHRAFSAKVIGCNLLAYVNFNLPKLYVSHVLGPAYLGIWNRGDVLSTVPIQQFQNSLIQALYPEFRHSVGRPMNSRALWTRISCFIGWVVAMGTSVGAWLAPVLAVPFLGDKWHEVRAVLPLLIVVGGVQLLSTCFASFAEALGFFRWIVLSEFLVFGFQVCGCIALVWWNGDLNAAVLLLAAGFLLRHFLQLLLVGNRGYVSLRTIARSYGEAVAGGVFIFVGLNLVYSTSQWGILEFNWTGSQICGYAMLLVLLGGCLLKVCSRLSQGSLSRPVWFGRPSSLRDSPQGVRSGGGPNIQGSKDEQ